MNGPLQKAYILYQQHRYSLAAEQLAQAIANEPDNVDALSLMGLTCAQLKDFVQAQKQCELALSKAPHYGFLHGRYGQVFFIQGDKRRALAPFEEAVRLEPTEALYRAFIGETCLNLGHFALALKHADQGLALDPKHRDCLLIRAEVLACTGRAAAAVETNNETLRLYPDHTHAHSQRGRIEAKLKNYVRAEECFLEALRLSPNNDQAHEGLAQVRNPNTNRKPSHRYPMEEHQESNDHNLAGTVLLVVAIILVLIIGGAMAATTKSGIPVGAIVVVGGLLVRGILRSDS